MIHVTILYFLITSFVFLMCIIVYKVLVQAQPHHETYLYNFDPLKLSFYIVKLGLQGIHICFLFFAQKHRLWVLVRIASAGRF